MKFCANLYQVTIFYATPRKFMLNLKLYAFLYFMPSRRPAPAKLLRSAHSNKFTCNVGKFCSTAAIAVAIFEHRFLTRHGEIEMRLENSEQVLTQNCGRTPCLI